MQERMLLPVVKKSKPGITGKIDRPADCCIRENQPKNRNRITSNAGIDGEFLTFSAATIIRNNQKNKRSNSKNKKSTWEKGGELRQTLRSGFPGPVVHISCFTLDFPADHPKGRIICPKRTSVYRRAPDHIHRISRENEGIRFRSCADSGAQSRQYHGSSPGGLRHDQLFRVFVIPAAPATGPLRQSFRNSDQPLQS